MIKLPDVIQLGPFPLPVFAVALLLSGYVWHSLAGRLAGRWGIDQALAEEFVYRFLVGALVGAKLAEVVRSPASFLASPRLLVSVPTGTLPVLAAVAGGALWACWPLRGRQRELPGLLDATAIPLTVGLAVASLGSGTEWSLPLTVGFMLEALALWSLRSQTQFPGQTALAAVVLGSLVFVASDFFRSVPTVTVGISQFQITAASVGFGAYALALRLARGSGEQMEGEQGSPPAGR